MTDQQKLLKLCELEEMSQELMLEEATFDGTCYGICMNEDCNYTTSTEPDASDNICEDCGTNTVKSCLVLAGIL